MRNTQIFATRFAGYGDGLLAADHGVPRTAPQLDSHRVLGHARGERRHVGGGGLLLPGR